MISKFFIERPVLSNVIAILMVLIGGVALFNLAVAQYPDVVPPTVQVVTSYPGASAETIAKTVATPLEQQINGVENMIYMSSQSTGDGKLTITAFRALAPKHKHYILERQVHGVVPRSRDRFAVDWSRPAVCLHVKHVQVH